MNKDQDVQSIKTVIAKYAAALNKSDAAALAALYTANGIFKARQYKAVIGREQIATRAGRFFKKRNMTIEIEPGDVLIQGEIAFANARGISETGNIGDRTEDFFVLLKSGVEWEIVLYTVNDVGTVQAKHL